jgi:hypothetical protein
MKEKHKKLIQGLVGLEAAIEYIEGNRDNIEYAYSCCNRMSTGLMFIKLKRSRT